MRSNIYIYLTDPGHVTDVKLKSLSDGFNLKWTKPPGIVHKVEGYADPVENGKLEIKDQTK